MNFLLIFRQYKKRFILCFICLRYMHRLSSLYRDLLELKAKRAMQEKVEER